MTKKQQPIADDMVQAIAEDAGIEPTVRIQYAIGHHPQTKCWGIMRDLDGQVTVIFNRYGELGKLDEALVQAVLTLMGQEIELTNRLRNAPDAKGWVQQLNGEAKQ